MREHKPSEPLTPEELLKGNTSKPLMVKLRCQPCGRETSLHVPWALVAPKADTDGWDGIILGRIFTCPSCGAIDDYELTTWAMLQLMVELKTALTSKSESCRVFPGALPMLFDGTTFQRPSQGLAHLREETPPMTRYPLAAERVLVDEGRWRDSPRSA